MWFLTSLKPCAHSFLDSFHDFSSLPKTWRLVLMLSNVLLFCLSQQQFVYVQCKGPSTRRQIQEDSLKAFVTVSSLKCMCEPWQQKHKCNAVSRSSFRSSWAWFGFKGKFFNNHYGPGCVAVTHHVSSCSMSSSLVLVFLCSSDKVPLTVLASVLQRVQCLFFLENNNNKKHKVFITALTLKQLCYCCLFIFILSWLFYSVLLVDAVQTLSICSISLESDAPESSCSGLNVL